ncbi:hypothetical protein BBJ28_00002491 [Nothophytophthora sp. Chile5]|nr:hypothetical protein BBJ28_00002491 [Nothophytophthora sp. Chile5]
MSSVGVCSAITHTGGRCSSAATDASGHCAHHARMARVMALAPKSLVSKASPSPSVASYSPATSSSVSSPSPASSGYKDLFGGVTAASPASSSVSSASSSSFAMTPMSNALPSASDLALLPGESVATTVACSFVFPAALGLPELPGALVITTFRLRFEPQSASLRTPGGFHRLLDAALRGMPRAAVAKLSYPQATATASRSISPYANGNGGSVMAPTRLVVKFKDLRSWTLGGDVMRLLTSLNRYAFVDSPLSLFAFLSGSVTRDDQEAHGLYDLYEDFARMGVALKDGSSAYRVTELNNAFAMCPTYPRQLVVPAAASDNEVGSVASFRSKGRLPICSFVHAHNGAALWRCAQPKRGILHAQSPADEQYLMHIARASTAATSSYSATPTRKIWIADCRPELNARVNNLTGGGTESGSLAHARVSFLNIGNIHAMRESLEAVRGLGGFAAVSSNTEALDLVWGARVEDTRWLSHVRRVLSGALQVARALEAQATTVVVHCSDGWDRTAQLCALAQLLVDSHYRTRRGFLEVVEKEWVRAGHKFQDRVAPGKAEDDDDQQAPIFLQFLDCVWQLTRSFPTHFEFNARMLETLADALFSGRYGTFLGNCERERNGWYVRERTPSLWALVLRDDRFVNPFYRANSARALLPEAPAVLRQVTLWSEYYFRGATFPAAPMGNSSPPLYAADGDAASGGAQEDLEVSMAAALQRIHLLEDQLHLVRAQAAAAAAPPPRPAPVSYPPLYSAASEADMSSQQLHPGTSNGGVNGYQSSQPSVSGYHHASSSSSSSSGGREPVAPVASTLTETPTWTCAVCSKANGVEALQCVVCGRTPR